MRGAAFVAAVEDAPSCLESVHYRHADVHQDHVRAELAGEADSLGAVGGLADDREVGLRGEQGAEAFAHHRLVVSDQAGDRVRHVRRHLRQREHRGDREAAARVWPRRDRAAEDRDALAHTGDAVAGPAAFGRDRESLVGR